MMKKLLIHIFILLSTSITHLSQDCKSILKIETNDSSALIYANENFLGKGKITAEVEKGEYIIVVRESLVKWNGYEVSDTIDVPECGKEYLLTYNLSDEVFVDSSPQDAAIIYNDSIVGYTPQFITLQNATSIHLKKGSSLTNIDYDALLNNKIQKIDFKPEIKTQSFTDSPWFKVLLGSAAALGATAAYFKLNADKKYDDYLIKKDRSILDEVDRLDLYSGIALGLLQVNIGYMIYRFLND